MSRGNYLKDRRRILAEGFRLSEFLTLCIREEVRLRKVRQKSEIAMTFEVTEEDWPKLRRLAGNRWRLTVLERRGAVPLFCRLLTRKSIFAGLALFIFLVTYQSLFIHEIRIDGFSRLTETEIRTALAEAGLYEGCRKTVDPNRVAVQMYRVLDNIAYCGIKYEGGLAQVYISERTQLPEKLDTSQYCHVVANKSGYIQKVTAKGGSPAVSADQYVEAGDILISGAYKVQDTTFESTGDGRLVYAHAMGEVLARVPYRFTIYLDRYDMAQSETGRQAPGFALTLGTQTFRTDSLFRPYDTAVTTEHPIITVSRPFPFRLSAVFSHEVASERVEKSQEELLSLAEMQLRLWAKKNLPENGEILNKDLKFTPKDNIIEVTIMLEVLEDIGREQVFIPAKAESAAQEPPPTM